MGENPNYDDYELYQNNNVWNNGSSKDIYKLQYYMKVIPVSFNKYGRFMLGHMKDLIDRKWLLIPILQVTY